MALDCKGIADEILEQIDFSKIPGLAIVNFIGNDESYANGLIKDCIKYNVLYKYYYLNMYDRQAFAETIEEINLMGYGYILIEPIPICLSLYRLHKNGDVDAIQYPKGFVGATTMAVCKIIDAYVDRPTYKTFFVAGRGKRVGKRIIDELLYQYKATVISTNSKTNRKMFSSLLKKADVIISAVGTANLIECCDVFENQIIIDVGICHDEKNGICGDVEKSIYEKVRRCTTVPGGVGLITRACLWWNLSFVGNLSNYHLPAVRPRYWDKIERIDMGDEND